MKSTNEINEFAERIVNTLREPLIVLNKNLRVIKASRSFYNLFRVTPEETIGVLIYELGNGQWNIPKLRELLETILPEKASFDDFEVDHNFPTIGKRVMLLNARPIERALGKVKIILIAFEDITNRRQIDDSLITGEELLRTAAESISDVIFNWDIKQKLDWYGDIDGIMGYAPGGYPRTIEGWAMTIHQDDKDRIIKALEDHLKVNTPYNVEYRVRKKDGEWRWWSARGNALLDEQGKPYKMIGSITDITDRKSAEESLRESHQFIEEIINSIPVRVFWKDRNLTYLGCNKIFAQDAGFNNPKELIGKDDFQMGWRDQAELYREDDRNVIETGRPKLLIEELQTTPEGKTITLLTSKIPLLDPTDKIAGILGTYMDITERKQIESALKTSEERFRTAAGSLTDVVYEWDLKDKVDWYGDIDSITGYLPGGFPRTIEGWEAVIHPEDKDHIITNLENHIKSAAPYNTEYRVKASDGGWRWWSARGTALRDDQGKPYKMIGSITDITEQKDIQNRIKFKSELLSHIGQSVIATDLQGKVIYWNNAAEEIYGWSSAEAMGKSVVVLTPAEQTKEQANEIMKELSGGNSWSGEFLVKRKDGSIFPAYVTDAPIIDSDGKLTGIIGISNDITERKRSEEKLQESEEKYRELVEGSPDGIIIHRDGKIVFANRSSASLMRASSIDQLIGKSVIEFVHPSYKEIVIDKMIEMNKTGKSLPFTEEKFLRLDDSEVDVEVKAVPIVYDKKSAVQIIVRDITERKRTEIERKVIYEITHGVTTTDNLDELLKLIHQSLSKVIYAENCFVALHDQNTGLFSFPLYKDKHDPVPKTAPLDKSCTSYVFRTGKSLLLSQKLFDQLVEQDEVELIGTNSPSWIGVPLEIHFRTIGVLVLQHYEKENVYTEHDIMFLDAIGREIAHVIERKLTEEETQKHNKQLFKLNAEKDKFFSIIAHDLRSPFIGFLNLTDLMADTTQSISLDEFAEYSKMLNQASQNIFMLLNNLLEWAQIQKGSIEFTPKNSDLSRMVSQSIDTIYQSALQKRIVIVNEINIPQKVYADEKSINTVLRNLLSNAIKFTRVDGKVVVNSRRFDDSTLQVSIEDNGVGISEDVVTKLFRIEEKVGSIGTGGEPSTGLGLLLCKEFVEMHGGKIWVESVKDKGSTFSFTLKEENGHETK